ncbi:MAG: hypothetical protein HYU66_23545 [Armatimonadetes bacterium]|nr:hypothetical protein [Armatimonadota bacterium]
MASERALSAAALYRRRGDTEAAWRALDDALAVDPDSAGVFALMGELNLDAEEWAAAAQCFRRALELQPELAAAEVGLGRASVGLEGIAGEAAGDEPDARVLARRKPETAFASSLVIPGLGQMYAGVVGRGAAFFVGALPFWALAAAQFTAHLDALMHPAQDAPGLWGLVLAAVYHLAAACDAWRVLSRLKAGA